MASSWMSTNLTPVKKLTAFLPFILGLAGLSINASYANDLTNGGLGMSPEAVKEQGRLQCKNRINEKIDEFNKACAEARLGQSETCVEKIEACDEIDSDMTAEDIADEELGYCPAVSASAKSLEKRVERLERKEERANDREQSKKDEIQRLEDDYNEATQEAELLAEERNQAREEYESAKAEIGAQRVEALNNARDQVERLQIEIEQAQDQIAQLWIELRAFTLENKTSCREQAVSIAQNVENQAFANKRAGRAYTGSRTGTSQFELFARGGKSARDEAIEEHDRYMRSCTSIFDPYNSRKITAFGDQYQQRKVVLRRQQRTLERTIRRLEKRKGVAKNFYAQTLNTLGTQESNALSRALRQEELLQNKAQLLKQRILKIQMRLFEATQELAGLQNTQRKVTSDLRAAEEKLSAQENSGKGITDKQIEAFELAQSLMKYSNRAKAENEDCGFDNVLAENTDRHGTDYEIPTDTDRSPTEKTVTGPATEDDDRRVKTRPGAKRVTGPDAGGKRKVCTRPGSPAVVACP